MEFKEHNVSASPVSKANDGLVRATFYTDCAKVKNGLALGVRMHAIVRSKEYSIMVYKPIFEQVFEKGLKYKSSLIDKRVVPTFFCEGCPEHYVEVPWLNLLTHIPLSRALKGQSEPVWYYIVRKEIYDSQRGEVLPLLRERLKETFHQSFLFQSPLEQIEYRPFSPYTLTQATLKNWYLQMTVFDFSGQTEEEKLLCLLIHEAWQRIRRPKLHTSVDEAAYDALSYQITYNNRIWTWPTPLPPKYNYEIWENCYS